MGKKYELLVTDVVGTTTPVSFFFDTLHAYVLREDIQKELAQLTGFDNAQEILTKGLDARSDKAKGKNHPDFLNYLILVEEGQILGLRRKDFSFPFYSDVGPTLTTVVNRGIRLDVYGAGKIEKSRLGFESAGLDHLVTRFLSSTENHFVGNKFVPDSYFWIAESARVDVSQMVYITDDKLEAKAAANSNIGEVLLIDREWSDSSLSENQERYKLVNNYGVLIDILQGPL